MRHIQKYTVPTGSFATYPLPDDTIVLSACEQHGAVVVYAEVQRDNPRYRQMRLHAVLTGDIAPPNTATFIDTVMLDGGSFVLHVYSEWVQ